MPRSERLAASRVPTASAPPRWHRVTARVMVAVYGWLSLTPGGDGFLRLWTEAQAAPIVDPTAPISFQPGIGSTSTGVPVVNITAPNDSGTSLNRYERFDVGPEGVVLNNSTYGGGTLLGGQVEANPNLSSGRTAGVIINEVTASGAGARSQLGGTVEVFGAPAAVIVANPNGISCSGCGATNATSFTLTTGTPLWADAPGSGDVAFDVAGGDISVGGAGLEGTVGRVDLIGGSLYIDGPIHAHYLNPALSSLNLTAGTGRVALGGQPQITPTGASTPRPGAIAIDATAMGAMTSGRISIVSTERGMGVNLSGPIVADYAGISVSSAGDLTLGNATAVGDIQLDADGNLSVRHGLSAGGDVAATAGGSLAVAGDTAVVGDLRLTAGGGVNLTGEATVGGDAAVSGSAAVRIGGGDSTIGVAGRLDVSGGDIHQAGRLDVAGSTSIVGSGDTLLHGDVAVGGRLDVSAGGTLVADGSLSAGGDARLAGRNTELAGETAVGGNLNVDATEQASFRGSVHAGGEIAVSAESVALFGPLTATSTRIDASDFSLGETGKTLAVDGDLVLSVSGPITAPGELAVSGSVRLQAGTDVHLAGGVTTGRDLSLTAGEDIRLDGPVAAGGTVDLNATGNVDVADSVAAGGLTVNGGNVRFDGAVAVAGNVDIHAAELDLTQSLISGQSIAIGVSGGGLRLSGLLAANEDLSIDAERDVVLAEASAGRDLNLVSMEGNIAVAGPVVGGRNAALSAGGEIAVSTASSGADLSLTAGGRLDAQTLAAGGGLSATAAGEMRITGPAVANGGVSLTAGGVLTVDGAVASQADVALSGEGVALGGTVVAGGGIAADAGTGELAASDAIAANGNVSLSGGRLMLEELAAGGSIAASATSGDLQVAGLLAANEDLSLDAEGELVLAEAGAGRDTTLVSRSGGIAVAGPVAAGHQLTLTAGEDVTASVLSSGGDLTVAAGGKVDVQLVVAGGALDARSVGTMQLAGDVVADGGVSLTAGGSLAVGGAVATRADVALSGAGITLGDLVLADGAITADAGTGELSAADAIAANGNVTLTGDRLALAGVSSGGTATLGAGANGLQNTGDLIATADIDTDATGAVRQDGVVVAGGAVDVTAGADVQLGSAAAASGSVQLTAGGKLTAAGDLYSGADMALSAGGDLSVARVASEGALDATAGGGITATGTIEAAGDLALRANGGQLIGADVVSGGATTVAASGDVDLGLLAGGLDQGAATAVTSGETVRLQGLVAGGDYLASAAGDHRVAGSTLVTGQATISAGGDIALQNEVRVGGALTSNAGGALAHGGDTLVLGDFGATSGGAQSYGGLVLVTGGLDGRAGAGIDAAGTVWANGGVALDGGTGGARVGGDLATDGNVQIAGDGDVRIEGESRFFQGGFISRNGSVGFGGQVLAGDALTISSAQDILFEQDVGVVGDLAAESSAGSIAFQRQLAVNGGVELQAQQDIDFNGATTLFGTVALDATAGAIHNRGTMQVAGPLAIDTTGDFVNESVVAVDGALSIHARNIDSNLGTAGGILADGAIELDASQQVRIGAGGQVATAGDVTLASTNGTSNAGVVAAGGKLSVSRGSFANSGTAVGGTVTLAGGLTNQGTLYGPSVSVAGSTNNSGTLAANALNVGGGLSNSGTVSADSVTVQNGISNGGQISAAQIQVSGGALSNGGLLAASGSLSFAGSSVGNSGTINAASLDLAASGTFTNSGTVFASGSALISAGGGISNAVSETARCVNPTVCNDPNATPDPEQDYRYTQQIGFIGAGDGLNLSGGGLDNRGVIQGGNITVSLGSAAFTNTRSTHDLLTDANFGSETPTTNTGVMRAAGSLDIHAGSLVNQGGTIGAGGSLDATLSGALENRSGDGLSPVMSGGNVTLGASRITNQGVIVATTGSLTATASSGPIVNNTDSLLAAADTLSLTGKGITNAGVLYGPSDAPRRIELDTQDGTFSNTSTGNVLADESLVIRTGQYANAGKVQSINDASLEAGSLTWNPVNAPLVAFGSLTLNVAGIDVAAGQTWIDPALNTTWTGVLDNRGKVLIAGNASGTVLNQASNLNVEQQGALPGGGTYELLESSTLTDPTLESYTDVGTRAQFAVFGAFSGSLTNVASDAFAAGSYAYNPVAVDQTATWVDAGGNSEVVSARSLPRLVTTNGSTEITLSTPDTGTIVADSLTIHGGDLVLGGAVDTAGAQGALDDASAQDVGVDGSPAEGGGASAIGGEVTAPDVAVTDPAQQAGGDATQVSAQGASPTTHTTVAGTAPASADGGDPIDVGNPGPGELDIAGNGGSGGQVQPGEVAVGTPDGGPQPLVAGSEDWGLAFPDWNSFAFAPGTVTANNLALDLEGRFTNRGELSVSGVLIIDAAGGIDNFGAAIQAGTLSLGGGGLDNREGSISADTLYAEFDGKVDNTRGRIEIAEGGYIGTGGDLVNDGGRIAAGELWLEVDGTLFNRTLVASSAQRESAATQRTRGFFDHSSASTTSAESADKVDATASIETTTGDLDLRVGGDLVMEGAELKSAGNLSALVKGDVKVSAVAERSASRSERTERSATTAEDGTPSETTRTRVTESSRTDWRLSSLTAAGDLTVVAEGDAAYHGTDLKAGGDLGLSAGGKLSVRAELDEDSRSASDTTVATGTANGEATRSESSHSESSVVRSRVGGQVEAGGALTLSAGSDLELLGVDAQAKGGKLALYAGGSIDVRSLAVDSESSSDTASAERDAAHRSATRSQAGGTLAGRDGVDAFAGLAEPAEDGTRPRGDLTLSGVTITAGTDEAPAAVRLAARDEVRIEAAVASSSESNSERTTTTDPFGLAHARREASRSSEESASGGTIRGSSVAIESSEGGVTLAGVAVDASEDVRIAGRSVALEAVATTTTTGTDGAEGRLDTSSTRHIGVRVEAGGSIAVVAKHEVPEAPEVSDTAEAPEGSEGTAAPQAPAAAAGDDGTVTMTAATLRAGGDLTVVGSGGVTIDAAVDRSDSFATRGRNWSRSADETVVGSELAAGVGTEAGEDGTPAGKLLIVAGDPEGTPGREAPGVTIRGSTLTAGEAAIVSQGSITVEAVHEHDETERYTRRTGGGMLSSKVIETYDHVADDRAVGSQVQADSLEVVSGGDLTVTGSRVEGATDTRLVVAGNTVLLNDADKHGETHRRESTGASFLGQVLGPLADVLPDSLTERRRSESTETFDRVTRSTVVASLTGDLQSASGGNLVVVGSRLEAAGKLDVEANGVAVIGALDEHSQKVVIEESGDSFNGVYAEFGKGAKYESTETREQYRSELVMGQLAGGEGLTVTAREGDIVLAGGELDAGEGGKLALIVPKGKLDLQAVKTIDTASVTKEAKDLGWQSMSGAGHYDETVHQNRMRYGELAVEVAGGIHIDIPEVIDGETVTQTVQALAVSDPALGWLAEMDARGEIDWRQVQATHERSSYEQSGLTQTGALVLAIVVTALTWGAASAAVGSTAGATAGSGSAMAAAGTATTGAAAGTTVAAGWGNVAMTSMITSMASNTAVQLINNGGDIGAALEAAFSEEAIRSYVAAGVTAGITAGLIDKWLGARTDPVTNTTGGLDLNSLEGIGDFALHQGARAVTGATVDTLINGGDFGEKLGEAFTGAAIQVVSAVSFHEIGDWAKESGIESGSIEKIAAKAFVGGIISQIVTGDFASGAIAAGANEALVEPLAKLLDENPQLLAAGSQMLGAVSADLAGGDAQLGSNLALYDTQYNYLMHGEARDLANAKERLGQCRDQACRDAAQADITRLETLDRTRNSSLDQACADPSSAACRIELDRVNAARDSYAGQIDGFDAFGVIGRERNEAGTLADTYGLRSEHAGSYNIATGAFESVATGVAGGAQLLVLTGEAIAGDPQAQATLGEIVKGAGAFLTDPVGSIEQSVKTTLDRADQLEAAGYVDEAQRMRAGLVTDGILTFSGGALLIKATGRPILNAVGTKLDNVLDVQATDALLRSGGVHDLSGAPLLDLKQLTNGQKGVMGELFGENTVGHLEKPRHPRPW